MTFFIHGLITISSFCLNIKLTQENKGLIKENETKNQLLSIVSHDLRSPVYTLKIVYEQMNDLLVKNNFIELRNLITNSQAIADNTYRLLDNLLHWVLAQANQFFYNKESLHLKSIIDQVLFNFNYVIASKNIKLSIDIPKDIYINADLNTINIALRNLIDNAVKYSSDYGVIDIKGCIEVHRNVCILTVEDHGEGIEKEVLESLFKTNNVIKGNHNKKVSTGLGLQLCKKILEENDAEINIKSVKNKGTKIIISLPLNTLHHV
ncbi:MAG: HAMP domain-containing histidine kinase [Flavobacteriaceae bacterium]|nr:HAMP domain-containing histidine kinase [Flavobacteriaceae bacterium]